MISNGVTKNTIFGRFGPILAIFGVFGNIFTLCFYNFWFFYTVFIIKWSFYDVLVLFFGDFGRPLSCFLIKNDPKNGRFYRSFLGF